MFDIHLPFSVGRRRGTRRCQLQISREGHLVDGLQHRRRRPCINGLKCDGKYTYHQVQHSEILYCAHTLYLLCVLYGSQNKQRLFPITSLFFPVALQPHSFPCAASRSLTLDIPHSVGLSGQVISPTHRQNTTLTREDIHAPGGIRTHNPSKRAAADPTLPYWPYTSLLD